LKLWNKAEHKILMDCLTFVPKVGKQTVQEWIKATEDEKINVMQEGIDLKAYGRVHFESMPVLGGFEGYGVNPIIKDRSDEEFQSARNIENDKLVSMAASEKANEEINAQPYIPNFLRPLPSIDSSLEDTIVEDAIWLFPGVLPEPCWDYTLGNNTSRVKTLMKKSLNGPLKKSNLDLITTAMKKDPEAVLHYGVHPSEFYKMVIHNKELAHEFLNQMSSYPIITSYYDDLIQTKVNLNSMELFNNLVLTHDLPKEYILLYIYNCFESCKEGLSSEIPKPKNADPATSERNKKRLVRLVSILIDFLLKKKSILVDELIKIKAVEFFEEHQDVTEANKILKQIKTS